MNENETSLYPVVEPSAFPITNLNQLESNLSKCAIGCEHIEYSGRYGL